MMDRPEQLILGFGIRMIRFALRQDKGGFWLSVHLARWRQTPCKITGIAHYWELDCFCNVICLLTVLGLPGEYTLDGGWAVRFTYWHIKQHLAWYVEQLHIEMINHEPGRRKLSYTCLCQILSYIPERASGSGLYGLYPWRQGRDRVLGRRG